MVHPYRYDARAMISRCQLRQTPKSLEPVHSTYNRPILIFFLCFLLELLRLMVVAPRLFVSSAVGRRNPLFNGGLVITLVVKFALGRVSEYF